MAPSHNDAIVWSLVTIASVAAGFMLYFLQPILIPFFIALMLSCILQPIISWLSTPRPFASLCSCCCRCFSCGGSMPSSPPFSTKAPTDLPRKAGATTEEMTEDSLAYIDDSGRLLTEGGRDGDTSLGPDGSQQFMVYCPRPIAIALSLASVILVATLVGYLVWQSVRQLQTNAPLYERGAEILMAQLYGLLSFLPAELQPQPPEPPTSSKDSGILPIAIHLLKAITPSIIDAFSFSLQKCLIVLVFLIYLLLAPVVVDNHGLLARIGHHVQHYVLVKTCISCFVGVAVGAILLLLEIDCALIFGLITFFANFIPTVGALFATLLPLPIVLLNPTLEISTQIMAILLPFLVHLFTGSVIEPYVVGDRMQLHPLVILLALVFWSLLWGIAGMILAVPLMVVARLVLMNFGESTTAKTMVDLLEGRLLSPVVEEYESR